MQQQPNRPRLTRDIEHKMLGGVCAGIARQYGYDITVVRIVTVLLTLVWGAGIVLYLALWAIMPAEAATPDGVQPVSGTLESGSGGSDSSGSAEASASAGFSGALGSTDDLAERARRAADDFAIAARSAAEAARVAAEQLADVAKAATAAGKESWEQQRSARQQPEATSTPPASSEASAHGDTPAPPMTPPPDYEATPPPGPDDARTDNPVSSP